MDMNGAVIVKGVEITPLLTPRQLQENSKHLNAQAGIDVEKINKALLEQIKRENKILLGSYNTHIENIHKIIHDLEEEKKFFEFKIEKLEKGDDKLIQFEKQIFIIDKKIKENFEAIANTEKDIANLQKQI